MKDTKKWIEKIAKYKELFLCLGVMIVLIAMTWQIWSDNEVGNIWLVVGIEVLAMSGLFWELNLMKNHGVAIEKQFLLIGIVFGVLFILVLPPGQSPDDINHYRRAYGITEGSLIADEKVDGTDAIGSELPIEIESFESMPSDGSYERLGSALVRGDSGEKREQAYTNTALYNFMCYLPQVLAALVGKALHMSTMGIAYLMEVFNFTVWVLLVYFAIKLIPKFKSVILFIALLPITLQEATSMAPDALTIGLGFFLVAFVMYLAYGYKKGRMKNDELVVLYVLAIMIGFCKIVYYPLVLLYLVIPEERFGGKRQKWIHLSIIFGVTLVLNMAWLAFSSGLLMEFNPGVDSRGQLIGIVKNPIKYLCVMLRTINASGQLWLSNMLGILIGSFSINLPGGLFFISFAFLIILIMQRDESIELKRFDRIVFICVFMAIVLLIFTSLYLQWTAVGSPIIDGIQGRYFLPILIMVPVMICRSNDTGKHTTLISDKGILYYSVFVDALAIVTILAQNI